MKKYIRADQKVWENVIYFLKTGIDKRFKKEAQVLINEFNAISRTPLIVMPDRLVDSETYAVAQLVPDVYEKTIKLGNTYIHKPFFEKSVYYSQKDGYTNLTDPRTKEESVVRSNNKKSFYIDTVNKKGWVFIFFPSSLAKKNIKFYPFVYKIVNNDIVFDADIEVVNKSKLLTHIGEMDRIWFLTKNLLGPDGETYNENNLSLIEYLKLSIFSNITMFSYDLGAIFTDEFYAVTETPIIPTDKKKQVVEFKGKTTWLKSLPPTIKFIRDFNDLTFNDKEGCGKLERRAHQKRGYWCTLKAERYTNHPLYMVFKGCYRRPCWVGPKEIDYEGNTYKIILQDTFEDTLEKDIN